MPLGAVLDSWIEELRVFKPLAVEVLVPGGELHFGLSEDKQDEHMLPTPFGCHEMSNK